MHVCLLRALAEDENRAERARRAPDLALLDAVTWPEFLWDTLRVLGDPLGVWSAYSGGAARPLSGGGRVSEVGPTCSPWSSWAICQKQNRKGS